MEKFSLTNFDAGALRKAVHSRLDNLTKPPGSLGRLEELVVRFAGIRGDAMPSCERKALYIFCADHGSAVEGVSAYPQEVTAHMVRNFVTGGAAINVLCRREQIIPIVVDMGVKGPPVQRTRNFKIAEGTASFLHQPAMTRAQAEQAMQVGRALAEEAAAQYHVAGIGEMGIGNTASASALLSVFSGRPAVETTGPGTGLDPSGVARKASLIQSALDFHCPDPADPASVLAAVGGFEIAAMTGFILGAVEHRLPLFIDGFVASAAVLPARQFNPDIAEGLFFAHRSAEPAHALMLELLGAEPYLDLQMRLGEGTGAALAMGILDRAVSLYREMATFSEAGISA